MHPAVRALGLAFLMAVLIVLGGVVLYLLGITGTLGGGLLSIYSGVVIAGFQGWIRGWSYLDLRLPSPREGLVVLGGIAGYGLLIALVALIIAVLPSGTAPATHRAIDQSASGGPSLLPLFFSAAIGAPVVEEVFFRNMLQKPLTGRIGGPKAIVAVSLLFASLHLWSYSTTGLSGLTTGVAIPLTLIFITSLLIGAAYWKTENLLVPIAMHASINAVGVFAAFV